MNRSMLLIPIVLLFISLSCDVQLQNPFYPTVARDYFPELEGSELFGSGDAGSGNLTINGTIGSRSVEFDMDIQVNQNAYNYYNDLGMTNVFFTQQDPYHEIGFAPFDSLTSGTTYTVRSFDEPLQDGEVYFWVGSSIFEEEYGYGIQACHMNGGTVTIITKTDDFIEGSYSVTGSVFDVSGNFTAEGDFASSGDDSTGDVSLDSDFNVAVSTSIEMAIPHELYGGIGYKHFEPIFYQGDSSELDYTGSLEGDLTSLPSHTITIDGSFDDWSGISAFFNDPSGDENVSVAGADLTDFYMAQDSTNLYVRFELSDSSPNTNNIYILHMADSSGFGWGSSGFAVMHDGTGWVGTTSYDGASSDGSSSDGSSSTGGTRAFSANGSISGLQIQIDTSTATLSGSPGDHLSIFGISDHVDSVGEEIELVFNLPPITANTTYTDADLNSLLDLKIGSYITTNWFSTVSSGTLNIYEYNPNNGTEFYIRGDYDVVTDNGDSLTGAFEVSDW